MPELRNCLRCGKLFAYSCSPICNNCLSIEEEEFKLVKEYVYDNPGAIIPEVSDATGVSIDKIMRFLREERLEISSENNNLVLECESCGKPIKSGKYCEQCKINIANDMKKEFGIGQKSQQSIKTTGKEKMYVTKRRDGH